MTTKKTKKQVPLTDKQKASAKIKELEELTNAFRETVRSLTDTVNDYKKVFSILKSMLSVTQDRYGNDRTPEDVQVINAVARLQGFQQAHEGSMGETRQENLALWDLVRVYAKDPRIEKDKPVYSGCGSGIGGGGGGGGSGPVFFSR